MKRICIALLTIGLLTACSDTTYYNYTFTGDSEHWKAEFRYMGHETWGKDQGRTTYDNFGSHDFELTYKGTVKDLSTMKVLEYSYRTNSVAGSRQEEFEEPTRTIRFTSAGASNGTKVLMDEVIHVHVKWDDQEETFELKN